MVVRVIVPYRIPVVEAKRAALRAAESKLEETVGVHVARLSARRPFLLVGKDTHEHMGRNRRGCQGRRGLVDRLNSKFGPAR
jgi:hypothetical protein